MPERIYKLEVGISPTSSQHLADDIQQGLDRS